MITLLSDQLNGVRIPLSQLKQTSVTKLDSIFVVVDFRNKSRNYPKRWYELNSDFIKSIYMEVNEFYPETTLFIELVNVNSFSLLWGLGCYWVFSYDIPQTQ